MQALATFQMDEHGDYVIRPPDGFGGAHEVAAATCAKFAILPFAQALDDSHLPAGRRRLGRLHGSKVHESLYYEVSQDAETPMSRLEQRLLDRETPWREIALYPREKLMEKAPRKERDN